MSFGQNSKRFFVGMIVCAFLIPIMIMLWNPQIGIFAILIGMGIAVRCIWLVRQIQAQGAAQDQKALDRRQDHGRTIYVSLVDAYGVPLDATSAQARLDAAEAQASPRDTVIGVHRTLA